MFWDCDSDNFFCLDNKDRIEDKGEDMFTVG